MNILLVGGCGYLGGAVLDVLAETEYEVVTYDALLYHDLYQRPGRFIRGNILDSELLLPELERADAVIWLAGLVGDAACAGQPEAARAFNVHSVRWLTQHYQGRIVYPSTCSVYGQQVELLDESAPLSPVSAYGQQKVEAEVLLSRADAVIFRLGTLFGLGDRYGRFRMDLAINGMTVQATRYGTITVHGGDQWRPFLHVRDAARAMTYGLKGEAGIYNLVGENLQISGLANLLAVEIPGLRVDWETGVDADPRDYHVSGEKADTMLGFRPLETVGIGVKEIMALVRSGRLANPDSPRFHNREWQKQTWGA